MCVQALERGAATSQSFTRSGARAVCRRVESSCDELISPLFLPQTVKEEKTWCVRSESVELVQGLLAWVRAQWEAMFGVKLLTTLQEEAAYN